MLEFKEDFSMATMNVSLPDEMKAFVEAQAAKEGFGTVSEYLRSVIRELQKRQAKQNLEAKLREALLSGPAEPMTREDWDDIEREGLERLSRERFSR
jgi:antitoxin ParD1/3/4